MGRTPSYDWTTLPIWAQNIRMAHIGTIEELEARVEELEGIVATLESDFEREAIRTIDGGVEAVYLEDHDEATCPSPDCPDRLNRTHGL